LRERRLPEAISEELERETVANWHSDVRSAIADWRDDLDIVFPSDLDQLTNLGIAKVFRRPDLNGNGTGLVFAGFGDNDIFPSMIEYQSYGMVVGCHISEETSRVPIDHNTPAWLSAFAQTSMSDTFSLGFSQDAYASLMRAATDGLREFGKELLEAAGSSLNAVADFDDRVIKVRRTISTTLFEEARKEHAYPLRRVLGVLPVDEMASLAETLINLQSLKEKVTKPSESVGGPIDVAVITRHEGLVWIKRKQFFDPAINSRYMIRQENSLR
jgi:hypothetical protein